MVATSITHTLKAVVLACALATIGCGAAITDAGRSATTGAIDAVTKKESALAEDEAKLVAVARETAIGAGAREDVKKLTDMINVELQKALADTNTNVEIDVRALAGRLRQELRLTIDESLGGPTLKEADALREQLMGPPLQKDVNALIDTVGPHLAQMVQGAVEQALKAAQKTANTEASELSQEADAAAAKWRLVAIGFAVGGVALLVSLAIAIRRVTHYQRTIAALQSRIRTSSPNS